MFSLLWFGVAFAADGANFIPHETTLIDRVMSFGGCSAWSGSPSGCPRIERP